MKRLCTESHGHGWKTSRTREADLQRVVDVLHTQMLDQQQED